MARGRHVSVAVEGESDRVADQVAGVVVKDVFTGKTYTVKARMVINATGPFSGTFVRSVDKRLTVSAAQMRF